MSKGPIPRDLRVISSETQPPDMGNFASQYEASSSLSFDGKFSPTAEAELYFADLINQYDRLLEETSGLAANYNSRLNELLEYKAALQEFIRWAETENTFNGRMAELKDSAEIRIRWARQQLGAYCTSDFALAA